MFYSQWLALPLHVRALIAQKFGIAKVGSTHVVGNEVVSDGYKIQDVETVLSSEAVKDYVGAEGDPATFISLLAAKVQESEVVAPEVVEPVVSPRNEPEPVVEAPKKTRKVTKRKK